jgi:hypothetical protein
VLTNVPTQPISVPYVGRSEPEARLASIRREEILDMVQNGVESSKRDYVLVDSHLSDYEVTFTLVQSP